MPPKPQRNVAKEVEQLRKQLAQLNARLAGPSSSRRSGRSRSRSRSRSRGGGPRNRLPAANADSTPSVSAPARGRKGLPGVTVRGHEMVRTVKLARQSSSGGDWINVDPGKTTIGAELSAMAKLFSQYRIKSLVFEYEPLCGTTTNGSIVLGLVPTTANAPALAFDTVSIMQPNKTGQLFARHSLTVPRTFLVEKTWYDLSSEDSPCTLAWWVDGDSSDQERSLGRIWARYEYEFQGFRKPS